MFQLSKLILKKNIAPLWLILFLLFLQWCILNPVCCWKLNAFKGRRQKANDSILYFPTQRAGEILNPGLKTFYKLLLLLQLEQRRMKIRPDHPWNNFIKKSSRFYDLSFKSFLEYQDGINIHCIIKGKKYMSFEKNLDTSYLTKHM